ENGKVSLPSMEISRLDLAGSMRLDSGFVDIVLQKLAVAGLTPAGGSIVASGRATGPLADVAVDLGVALPGSGSGHLGGRVALGLSRYRLGLAIENVDPHTLRAELQPGHVNLRLTARGDGSPGQPGSRLALALLVTPSQVQGIDVHRATIRSALDGRNWRLESADAD